MYEDGYSVYLDEFLTEVYDTCEERPTDPSLKSLIQTHAKCLKESKRLRPIITMVEGEKRGEVLFVKGDDVYVLECRDVSEKLLEDPDYAEVLAAWFDDEELAQEVNEAEKVIICTIKRRKMSKKEKEEVEELTST